MLPHSGMVGIMNGVLPGRGVSVAGALGDGVAVAAAGVGAARAPNGMHALVRRKNNRVRWASFMRVASMIQMIAGESNRLFSEVLQMSYRLYLFR